MKLDDEKKELNKTEKIKKYDKTIEKENNKLKRLLSNIKIFKKKIIA